MSLANPSPLSSAAQSAADIRYRVAQLRSLLFDVHADLFRGLWRKEGATPQQVLDELGSEAAELFYQGGINCRFLALIDAPPERWNEVVSALDGILSTHQLTIPLDGAHYIPPSEYAINPDGTVNIIND